MHGGASLEELHFEPSFRPLDLSQKAFQLLDDVSQNFQEALDEKFSSREKIAPPEQKKQMSTFQEEQKASLKERQLQETKEAQAKTKNAARALLKQKATTNVKPQESIVPETLIEEQKGFDLLQKISQKVQIPANQHQEIIESLTALMQQVQPAIASVATSTQEAKGQALGIANKAKVNPAILKNQKAQKLLQQQNIYRDKIEDLKQKIARQMRFELRMALKKGVGEVRMRLKPEVLGQVKIQLVLEEGSARAHFNVESQSVKDLMISEIQQLQRALQEGGFAEQEIYVEVDEREQRKSSDQELHKDWIDSFQEVQEDKEVRLFDTEDLLDMSF